LAEVCLIDFFIGFDAVVDDMASDCVALFFAAGAAIAGAATSIAVAAAAARNVVFMLRSPSLNGVPRQRTIARGVPALTWV
jgi:hypothetical protein